MPGLSWEAMGRAREVLADGLRGYRARYRLRNDLGRLTEAELDCTLADAGLSRSDLATIFAAGSGKRSLMARMMTHFGIDPKRAALRHWGALREAEATCARCGNARRCRRWFEWGLRNDAPRVFCPNAERFDEIARRGRD